jgi:hypothetical protein
MSKGSRKRQFSLKTVIVATALLAASLGMTSVALRYESEIATYFGLVFIMSWICAVVGFLIKGPEGMGMGAVAGWALATVAFLNLPASMLMG